MYHFEQLKRLHQLGELAPEAWNAFVQFDRAATREGTLSRKAKELIAVSVALATQCPYCIELHAGKARDAGASEKELAEAALVTSALRAGGAAAHATHFLHD